MKIIQNHQTKVILAKMNKHTLTRQVDTFIKIDMFHRSDGNIFQLYTDTTTFV